MRKRFDYVTDSSHGWLKVPMAELERLNIVDDISTCSYVKNDMAYLEEDSDMAIFLTARQAREEKVNLVEHARKGSSRIRNYPMFGGERLKTVVSLSGQEVTIQEDTPRSCDPSTELHWSM